jgi:thiosulfate reductase cytochrome b subunit
MKRPTTTQTKSGLKVPVLEAGIRGKRESFAYEHPYLVRLCHWVNAISLFVLIASGLRIFRAFPSFGPKIPQHDLVNIPDSLTLGYGLAGALQWHFTFMFPFVLTGLLYAGYQLASGHYRQVLFRVCGP